MLARLALCLILLASLTFSSGASLGSALPYAAGEACAVHASLHEDPCFHQLFAQAVDDDAASRAIDLLTQLMARGALDDCHMLAHQLGQDAVRATGSLVATFKGGDLRCAAGYYHGAAADFIDSGGDPARACTPITDARLHRECVHGVGHGVFLNNPRRDAALATCTHVLVPADAGECRGGVLMEAAMELVMLEDTTFSDRFVHLCDGLQSGTEDADACQQNLGEAAMFRHHHVVPAALEDCARLPDEDGQHECVHGVTDEESLVVWERAHPDEWP